MNYRKVQVKKCLHLLRVCALLFIFAEYGESANGLFRITSQFESLLSTINDEPLYLTPYIEAGKIEEARTKSQVKLAASSVISFSGFFTVDKQFNSNLFMWFFPAVVNPEGAPVLVWLQGGPGGSSLFGLFMEHGPFSVDKNFNLVLRNYTWVTRNNVLYIDNPVGTGFSFTNDDAGYATNEDQVGESLYKALLQFFTLFHELQHSDLYITGESYAGKYVPALTYYIHKGNKAAKLKLNLQGMAIGDGLCDPISMTDYGDLLYYIGLLDELDRQYFKSRSKEVVTLIHQKKWVEAFKVFDALLNGDKTGYPSYFQNVTGLKNYFNYLLEKEPEDLNYWVNFINKDNIRQAIHVGNLTFNNGSKVEDHLLEDVMQSVKPWIEEILNEYRVLFYNGQLDIIVSYTLTDNFLKTLKWKHEHDFKNSSRIIWHVDNEIAGYVRQVPNFAQVLVRNAGHMVPYDQPKWALDMISRFINEKTFS